MPRNIEIKARAWDLQAQMDIARQLADRPPLQLHQEDTFFHVPNGRLKLRVFEDGSGELIQYQRADNDGPSESRYVRSPTAQPQTLKAALANALGVRAIVRKERSVYLTGQTRIHLDRVEGLGEFIELEVVLEDGQPMEEGVAIAEALMAHLRIDGDHLVESAYVDLLVTRPAPSSGNGPYG